VDLRAGNAGLGGAARGEAFVHGWIVGLRRLESLLLHGEIGHSTQVGRQVRNQYPRAAIRLRAVAWRLRRQEHRHLRDDQHGGSRHASGGRRRHHGCP